MSGDVVLVTGGASGLGAEIVRAFHRHGFRVGVGDLNLEAATALAGEIGNDAVAIALDVREEASFEAARDALVARWGSVEALVNNAAMTAAKPVLDITPEEFDAVTAVNLRGTFVGSRVFGKLFKEKGYGRIMNLASLAGQNGGTATGAHYAASKGGIMTLTKVFARDLAAFGVTVNAIAPGPLDSPMVRSVVGEANLAAFLANVPVKQLGSPAFVADIAARLCARDASFVTGATWDINGGLYMR